MRKRFSFAFIPLHTYYNNTKHSDLLLCNLRKCALYVVAMIVRQGGNDGDDDSDDGRK